MARRSRYILKRFGLTILAIYAIMTILFFIFRLMPSDPAMIMLPLDASEQARNALRDRFGLNEPLYIQYVKFLVNTTMGNLGISFAHGKPVSTIIVDRTLNTISLFIPAVIISFTIGPLIGSILAWYRGTNIDTVGIGLILVMRGAPVFWTGMLGIMIFSFQLELLPTGGMRSVDAPVGMSLSQRFLSTDFLYHLALPLSVVVLYFLSSPAFIMRNTMIDVLNDDFIELLHAEGLPEVRIIYLHAARNSLLPITHYFALAMGAVFGGSVVIETVFSWPGVGHTMFRALENRDYPLVQGAFLIVAIMVIFMNFLADVASVYIDPRTAEEE